MKELSAPALEFIFELTAHIGPPTNVEVTPQGLRRVIPITGGVFEGPEIRGRVVPGGADTQLIREDGLTLIDASYAIETHDGVRIGIRNRGVRYGPKEVMARLLEGKPVDPGEYYFRTTPCFEPSAPAYEWLRQSVYVGNAARYVDRVVLRVWRVE